MMKLRTFKLVGGLVLLGAPLLFMFQNCGQKSNFNLNESSLKGEESVSGTGEVTCLFNGFRYLEGESVLAYQNSTVAAGSLCVSEQSFCHNGSMSSAFNYASCIPGSPADCKFDGKQIKHGDSVDAYKAAATTNSLHGSVICEYEKRQCDNGVLSGSYTLPSCPTSEKLPCRFDGRTISHGETVKAYEGRARIDTHKLCRVEERTCDNGVLSGSFKYSSCSENSEQNTCLFAGRTIAEGESVTAARRPVVSATEIQACEFQKRTCVNGHLTGTFQFESCAVETPPILEYPPKGGVCIVTVSPQAGSEAPSWQLVIHNNTTTIEKYYTSDSAASSPTGSCHAETISCKAGKASSADTVYSGCAERGMHD